MSSVLAEAVDPVVVEIIRNGLNAAADEMSVSLARSAYTPIIYEMKDYSVALYDTEYRLLGQSPGLPIFLGALEDAIRVSVEKYGVESLRPGDVFLVNDPYLVGSHLNDMSVCTPMFFEGELVGYAASKAHWLDIGAKEPSQTMSGTEIYQEGYRIPPIRIVRGGEMNQEVLDLLTLNSRLPRGVKGDFAAMVAACRTGENRVQALLERFGRDVVGRAADEIFDQCERLDREFVAALPDGEWSAQGYMDSDGNGSDPVLVKLRVEISGSDIHLDLTGSSPQTGGCLNSGLSQTVSAARLAFKFLINADVSATGGTFRNLKVTAESGSIFAAVEPAACQYYYPHAGLMIDLFITLMAEVMPEQVTAAQCADPMNVIFDGIDEHNQTWVVGEAIAIGWGASATRDGENALANYGGGDLKNYPIEVLEAKYPIMIDSYGLRPDSGGAGRQRGGLALVREFTAMKDASLSLWLERTVTGPWGIFGGETGSVASATLQVPGGDPQHLLKCSHVPFPAGSTLYLTTGGGGGYGPAGDRDRALIESNLADGYITAAGAERDYGYRS